MYDAIQDLIPITVDKKFRTMTVHTIEENDGSFRQVGTKLKGNLRRGQTNRVGHVRFYVAALKIS